MKISKAIYLTLAISMLGFFSCIKEDNSMCPPPHNVELDFVYKGDTNDPAMFLAKFEAVNLYVFDEKGNAISDKNQILSKAQLAEKQGTLLFLEEGKYKIVCWGNVFEQTELKDMGSFASGRINSPNLTNGTEITTNDSLYYGIYEVNISNPKGGAVPGEVVFRGAHIKMKVYVSNYTDSNGNKNAAPRIEMTNVMPQFDMNRKDALPATKSYFSNTEYNEDIKMAQTFFNVLNFAKQGVEIKLFDPITGEQINTGGIIDVNKLVSNSTDPVINLNNNEITIPVRIRFVSTGTIIEISEWNHYPVVPGR